MREKLVLMNRACVVCALFLVLGVSIAAQTFDAIKSQVKVHVLENGMKFIVLERHEAPVVSFHVYADVGSANESYGITGISHLLEHMAFKGSKLVGTTNYEEEVKVLEGLDALYEKIKAEQAKVNLDEQTLREMKEKFEALRLKAKEFVVNGEFDDMFMREGDRSLNAFTSADATQYVNSLPSNKLEFWMAMTADRFQNPVFREFYKERDVVIEERRLSLETRPIGRLVEDFLSTAFKAHPYKHSVVGHMSDLESITRRDVEDYFRKYYGPSNLTVSIVGDVGSAEVFEMAELYFGTIPSEPKPEALRTKEPEQWGERQAQVVAKSQPILIMGYHRPDVRHADSFALDALANILGQGRSSRLHESLVKDKKVCIQSGVFNGFPGEKYPNLVAFIAVPSQGHTSEECLELIDDEIAKIKEESVTADELTKYKRSTVKAMLSRMKSNGSMAELLTYADVVLGDWQRLFGQVEQLQSVSVEDVKRVAKMYLVDEHRTIGEIVPEGK
ncbi:MAG TPA: pitrilysin family protein [Candidatus Heimdallarchaeota archaeon]|nr:pitrilysin family protein [Candidatus Heimdallarchaeota archaeon]